MDILPYLSRMKEDMKLRNLSPKTVSTYLYHTERFLSFTRKPPETMKEEDIKKFIHYFFRDNGSNHSSVRQCLSALSFLFNIVLDRSLLLDFPYPKRERKLPIILTRDEVSRLLNATTNQKHRLILKLIYSCGLRVSEAVKIKITDIDLENRTIHIRKAKGKRDRIAPIPGSLLPDLYEFIHPENRNPYLFKSRSDRNTHLSVKSVQSLVKDLSGKSRIKKRVHPHTLRHSFATHLLDQGTDIRLIQEFLGHKRITTTELYTQVSKASLKRVRNPLDEINRQMQHKPTQTK